MIAAPLAALILAFEPAPAPGPDARSVRLDRAFPFWSDYLDLPADERSAFTLDYVVKVRSGEGAAFWVETAEGYLPLVRDAAGAAVPPRGADFDPARRLYTDAPEGGVAISMRLAVSGPPRSEYDMAELEAALAQAGGAVRRLMGLRSPFMPRLDTLSFRFDGPAPEAALVFEDGGAAPVQTVYGEEITIQPGDRALRGVAAVRFARPPQIVVLETGN